jgi:hypothetical protein
MVKQAASQKSENWLTLGGIPIRKLSGTPIVNKRIYDGRAYHLEDGRIFIPHGNYDRVSKFGVASPMPPDGEGKLTWTRTVVRRHDLARSPLIPSSRFTSD